MNYEFAPIGTDFKSIKEIVALLQLVFPNSKHFSEQYIRWQYLDNPDGEILGYNAYQNGLLVAHYALQPIRGKLFNNLEKGVLSLNTATHPSHQGKKLFTTLAEMSYRMAASRDKCFVVGVANANSTYGFINKLGFQFVGKLTAKIGIGKLTRNNVNAIIEFQRFWNVESVKWRLSNPEVNYRIKSQTIYSSTHAMGIDAIMSDFQDSVFLQNRKQENVKPIKLWIGIDNSINWKKSLYFDVPNKFRPSPLNLIFKDLTHNNRKLYINNVLFSALDFDAF